MRSISSHQLDVGSNSPLGPLQIVSVPLSSGGSIAIAQHNDCAQLQIASPGHAAVIEIEIRFDKQGPVVRVRAPALEIDAANRVSVRCESFEVEATEKLSLRCDGDVVQHAGRAARIEASDVTMDASPGAIRLRANDDVQLLGENILLNCERQSPLPAWTQISFHFQPPSRRGLLMAAKPCCEA